MSVDRPIGVFDSGMGGLTVLKALSRRMPGEHLVYFGDTAHLPYGSKSKEAVERCALQVGRYLLSHDIKLMVVACNTASALALERLQAELPIPVIGVLEPGVRAASSSRARRVGVIATEATVKSGGYQKALERRLPGVRAVVAACPLFVPLVEEGWWSHPLTTAVAARYLKPLKQARVDTLILGCTHYPLLKPVLRKTMGSSVRLIDSAEQTAREADSLLEQMSLRRRSGEATRRYFVSDGPERFLSIARRISAALKIREVSVWRFD